MRLFVLGAWFHLILVSAWFLVLGAWWGLGPLVLGQGPGRLDRDPAEQAFRPWSTPLTARGTFEGIAVPTAGSGAWGTGADAYEYIRLRVTSVAYDSPL